MTESIFSKVAGLPRTRLPQDGLQLFFSLVSNTISTTNTCEFCWCTPSSKYEYLHPCYSHGRRLHSCFLFLVDYDFRWYPTVCECGDVGLEVLVFKFIVLPTKGKYTEKCHFDKFHKLSIWYTEIKFQIFMIEMWIYDKLQGL